MGGVLALSTILALSLMFASCNNNSNSDDDNSTPSTNPPVGDNPDSNDKNNPGSNDKDPSPTLPEKVGENPIKKTIRLIREEDNDNDYDYYYLELNPDGTALYVYFNSDEEEPEIKFKYTYNASKEEIYMQVEEVAYYSDIIDVEDHSFMNYNESISQIDKDYTVDNLKKFIKSEYEDEEDKESSYEDFEKNWYKEQGFDTLEASLEYQKQIVKARAKAGFGVQITFSYKIDGNGKMTLTEKFTGVKNLLVSECGNVNYDSPNAIMFSIYSGWAQLSYDDKGEYEYEWFTGVPDTDEKTIFFRKYDDGSSTVNANYTENISEETVTIKFNSKESTGKFDGAKFSEK